MADVRRLPPGLREFAADEGLSEESVQTLAETWGTIRGLRPQTAIEWKRLWELIKTLMDEEGEISGR